MDKKQFRTICKQKLYAISKTSYYRDKIWLKLMQNELKSYKNILLYMPLSIEPDTNLLIKWLKRNKKRVFVPFIVDDRSMKMVIYRLPLYDGQFNIKSCGNSLNKNLKIDLAVVPAIGIDNTLKRIGFGKGFYDRFFANLNYKPAIILTQRVLCCSKSIITQTHDICGDKIVTSQGIFYKRFVKNVDRTNRNRQHNGRRRLFCCQKNRCL